MKCFYVCLSGSFSYFSSRHLNLSVSLALTRSSWSSVFSSASTSHARFDVPSYFEINLTPIPGFDGFSFIQCVCASDWGQNNREKWIYVQNFHSTVDVPSNSAEATYKVRKTKIKHLISLNAFRQAHSVFVVWHFHFLIFDSQRMSQTHNSILFPYLTPAISHSTLPLSLVYSINTRATHIQKVSIFETIQRFHIEPWCKSTRKTIRKCRAKIYTFAYTKQQQHRFQNQYIHFRWFSL